MRGQAFIGLDALKHLHHRIDLDALVAQILGEADQRFQFLPQAVLGHECALAANGVDDAVMDEVGQNLARRRTADLVALAQFAFGGDLAMGGPFAAADAFENDAFQLLMQWLSGVLGNILGHRVLPLFWLIMSSFMA